MMRNILTIAFALLVSAVFNPVKADIIPMRLFPLMPEQGNLMSYDTDLCLQQEYSPVKMKVMVSQGVEIMRSHIVISTTIAHDLTIDLADANGLIDERVARQIARLDEVTAEQMEALLEMSAYVDSASDSDRIPSGKAQRRLQQRCVQTWEAINSSSWDTWYGTRQIARNLVRLQLEAEVEPVAWTFGDEYSDETLGLVQEQIEGTLDYYDQD